VVKMANPGSRAATDSYDSPVNSILS
jgi:hypothetical protein